MATSLPQFDPLERMRQNIAARPRLPQNPPGQLSPGNIDVFNRPIVPNPDGGTSTILSSSYGDNRGEHLIPLVSDGADGRPPHIMGEREAERYSRNTRQNLGTFDSPANATAYGQSLHKQQEALGSFGGRTTMPAVITPDIINSLRQMQTSAPPLASLPAMSSVNPLANSPAPTLPNVSLRPPTSQDITGSRLLSDQTELKRLGDEGSGISQIKSTGLRRLAKTANVVESILAPRAAAVTPGTEENHQRLLNQQTGRVNSDLANQQSQAQTTLLDAQPQLKMMGLENAQLRNQAYSQHVADQGEHYGNQDTNHLRDSGYTLDETDPTGQKIRPLRYEEMSEKQQATEDLKHAQTEQAEATAAMKKAQNDPTSPAFKLAKQRADAAQFNANTARQRLGLSQAQYNMHAYGTDASGQNELPGILHDEAGRGVGSVQASNVRPTTMSRDAASRADSMVDIGNRLRAGLADPEIQSYLGPLRGRVSSAQGDAGMLPEKVAKFRNDLVSYGAFQAGLHPVRGIGALQYFDHVMGGLGQTPESLLGKLNSNDETAADVQKVGAMPTTAGIARAGTAPHGPPNRGGVQVFKDGGTTYHIPADQVAEFKRDHPNAR